MHICKSVHGSELADVLDSMMTLVYDRAATTFHKLKKRKSCVLLKIHIFAFKLFSHPFIFLYPSVYVFGPYK